MVQRPTGMTVEGVSGDNITVSWTDEADTELGYRVYVSTDDGATWTLDSGDLAENTTQYETSDLLDGEEYTLTVEVFNNSESKYDGEILADCGTTEQMASPVEVTFATIVCGKLEVQ